MLVCDCENVAVKLRQKWYATAGNKFQQTTYNYTSIIIRPSALLIELMLPQANQFADKLLEQS